VGLESVEPLKRTSGYLPLLDKANRSRDVVCFEKGQGKFGTEASALQPSLRHEAVAEHPFARQKRRLKEQNVSWQSCERSSASRHSVFFQETWLEHVGGVLFRSILTTARHTGLD